MTTPITPSNPPSDSGDTPLDAALFSLRDTPAPSTLVREAHIAEALTHVSAPTNVVALRSRRQKQRRVFVGLVAAAGLFAAGIGLGQVSRSSDSTSNNALVKNATIESAPVGSATACVTDPKVKTFVLGAPPMWVVAVRTVLNSRVVTVFNATTCAVEWQLPANK